MRKGGLGYRIRVALFVFAASGVIHAGMYRVLGFWCGWWEEMGWWMLNFGAILVEDLVCAVFGGMVGKRGSSDGPGWRLKLMGYVWVFAFQFWSLPKQSFSKAFCYP